MSNIIVVFGSIQVVANDLHPYYQYRVQVAAVTVQIGPQSDPAIINMPESGRNFYHRPMHNFYNNNQLFLYAEPSSAPLNFLSESITTLSTRLVWSPPPEDSHNGVLLGYTLTCKSDKNHVIFVQASGTATTLTELHSDSHYTCTVCAFTSVGCGPTAVTYISTYEECKWKSK